MKKYISFITVFVMLFSASSCNRRQQITVLQGQVDSIQTVSSQQQYLIEDMTSFIAELSGIMDTIKMQESILTMKVDENGRPLGRKRILENLNTLETILAEKRLQINSLDSLLKARTDEVKNLSMLVTHLYDELDQKEATIQALQNDLSQARITIRKKDKQIAALNDNVTELESRNQDAQAENSFLKEQLDNENYVYYLVANKARLLEYGIFSDKGLFKTGLIAVLDNSNIDLSHFAKDRIENVTEFIVDGKKPKILTDMPSDSYTISSNGKKRWKIQITNSEKFWSLTKILIVQTI